MKILRCGVTLNVRKCVKMLMFILFVKQHMLVPAIAVDVMLYMLYIIFVFAVHYNINKVKCMMFKMLNKLVNETMPTKIP